MLVPAYRDRRAPPGINRTTFANFLISVVWANCVSAFLYHLTGSEHFQTLGNVVAILTVSICIAISALGKRFHSTKFLGIFILTTILVSFFVNKERSDFVDAIKLFEIFAIFAAARECVGELRINRAIYGLMFLPFVLIFLGGSRIPMQAGWSFFPNTNTAALFYLSLFFTLSIRQPKNKIAWQIGMSIASGRVGVLIASISAIIASGAFRLKTSTILLVTFGIIVFLALIFSGYIDRQLTVVSNLGEDIWSLGIFGIANSNFSSLYKLRGNDLSGYFRIIHWSEIIQFWSHGGVSYWIFGYGGGYTQKFTTLELVPHNDYLKVLVEFGILSFISFVALLLRATFGIRNKVQRALFLVMVFYFVSDNLLTNFASMALMFGFAGLIFNPNKRKKRVTA